MTRTYINQMFRNSVAMMRHFACLNDPGAPHWAYAEYQSAAIAFASR